MIHSDRFLISHRPYAVDLDSLRIHRNDRADGTHFYRCDADTVWFRRRRGQTVACIGTLWDFQDLRPADTTQFLRQLTDGRYGGRCAARWDGRSYWSEDGNLEQQEAHLAILRPALAAGPAVPAGYNGWWQF